MLTNALSKQIVVIPMPFVPTLTSHTAVNVKPDMKELVWSMSTIQSDVHWNVRLVRQKTQRPVCANVPIVELVLNVLKILLTILTAVHAMKGTNQIQR